MLTPHALLFSFFFFNDTATTEIYTLSLHDALPISWEFDLPMAGLVKQNKSTDVRQSLLHEISELVLIRGIILEDRKSTRLNSSHGYISYAVFCLKKKNNTIKTE